MNDLLILVVGFGAAIGTTAAWLPQVAHTWKTRSAHDFSWGYLGLFMMGVFLWTMYGVLRRDLVIVLANGITLLLVMSVGLVKAREKLDPAIQHAPSSHEVIPEICQHGSSCAIPRPANPNASSGLDPRPADGPAKQPAHGERGGEKAPAKAM